MNNTQNKNKNSVNTSYATPFNVDLFSYKLNNSFMEYFRRIGSLPNSIKDVMANPSTAEFIEENLGQTFGLNDDQKTEITRILRDILLSDLFWGDFSKTISTRLQVPPDTANQIVKALTDGLLAPALEDIKAMQKEKFSNRYNNS